MSKKRRTYSVALTVPVSPVLLDTQLLWDVAFTEPNLSAIDLFYQKTQELNVLITDPRNIPPQLPNLIVMGYVSAVESYFRTIIRTLVNLDSATRLCCESQLLTYGAVLAHSDKEMLPEALLERSSFANEKNIRQTMKELVGLKDKQLPREMTRALDDYDKVCQLRHCIVHRFGRLGSNNAIRLGLDDHRHCIEKPIRLDYGTLQSIYAVCHNVVKAFNGYLFHEILNRSAGQSPPPWSWDYRRDRRRFEPYFKAFVSASHPPSPALTAKQAYDKFRDAQ